MGIRSTAASLDHESVSVVSPLLLTPPIMLTASLLYSLKLLSKTFFPHKHVCVIAFSIDFDQSVSISGRNHPLTDMLACSFSVDFGRRLREVVLMGASLLPKIT
jgi:hypothetical protein